jgi:hypothetical protein
MPKPDKDGASVEALKDALQHLHGRASRWVESVDVHERLGEVTVRRDSPPAPRVS